MPYTEPIPVTKCKRVAKHKWLWTDLHTYWPTKTYVAHKLSLKSVWTLYTQSLSHMQLKKNTKALPNISNMKLVKLIPIKPKINFWENLKKMEYNEKITYLNQNKIMFKFVSNNKISFISKVWYTLWLSV